MGTRAPLMIRWMQIATQFLPFADAATRELPLSRLLRLSLFQVSVGMAAVLLTGTLNRVMIIELGIPSWLVALVVAIPLVFAPLRALIGYKSDTHRSVLGWKRVPYIWFGTLLQFGGFAIMPFALIVMSGDTHGPIWVGQAGAALAFLLVGAGMHTTQTAGLALATDLATPESRPRVVALLYVMLLVGTLFSALFIGAVLNNFSSLRLIQVIQGAAGVTMILNVIALWKQEARNPAQTSANIVRDSFTNVWAEFISDARTRRLLIAVGLGAAAFSMQDVLLEPYGGEVLGMSVGQTTSLTALWAFGALSGFGWSAYRLSHNAEPHRLAATGGVVGIFGFAMVVFASPLSMVALLALGIALIGFGGGLFSVGTLTAAMALAANGKSGLALGAWGAVQASCAGIAIALGGILRDVIAGLAADGSLGEALTSPATSYGFVYHIEIALLFAALIALGPLVRRAAPGEPSSTPHPFGLTEFPT
jgi:MFS transporter, BCD family, chlorophyll transporter